MDIGAIGIVREYTNAQSADLMGQVQTKLLRTVMDQEEQNAQQLLECMPPLNPPNLGNIIDCYA